MESPFQRVILYATNFDNSEGKFDKTMVDKLVDCAAKGFVTHVVIGLFHINKFLGPYDGWFLSWNNEAIPTNTPLPDSLAYIQKAIKEIKSKTVVARGRDGAQPVKVLASFGGDGRGRYGVRDFEHLLLPENFEKIYPIIPKMLADWKFDGIDLDIEEGSRDGESPKTWVSTENVVTLVTKLRTEMPSNFVIAAAPVASALMEGGRTMTTYIDWLASDLVAECDFYILQFYNTFGDLKPGNYSPDFDELADSISRRMPELVGRLVAGTPTSSASDVAGQGFCTPQWLSEELPKIAARHYPKFGLSGWNFQKARVSDQASPDPIGWLKAVDFRPDRDFTVSFQEMVTLDLRSFRTTPPVLIAINDRLHMFYQGKNAQDRLMRCEAEFSPDRNPFWTNIRPVNDVKINRSPSVIAFQNKIYLFYSEPRSSTLECLVSEDQGKNFKQHAIAGIVESRFFIAPRFAILPASGTRKERLCLLGVNLVGQALKYAYTEDGTHFTEGYTHRDSRDDMIPALVQVNGKLVGIFCAKSDADQSYGQLFATVSTDGVGWGPSQRLHLNTSAAPSAVVHRGYIHLFYRDPTGNGIYHRVSCDGGQTFGGCVPDIVVKKADEKPDFIVIKNYLVGVGLYPCNFGPEEILSVVATSLI